MLKAEILSVGTELLLGDIVNTNAAYLSKKLAELGITVHRQSVVGDNADRLHESIEISLRRADILIMTGGLGPTSDDITKKIAADVFSRSLILDESVKEDLIRYFAATGREMTENNLSQAMIPEGAVVLPNTCGTAPGVIIEGELFDSRKTVVMLPGPPREMTAMYENSLEAYLKKRSPYTLFSLNLHLYGIGESTAEYKIRHIIESSDNPTVAPYAAEAEVRLRITARAESREEAMKMCREKADVLYKSDIGQYVRFESTSDDDSKDVAVNTLITLLRERNMTLGTAESCTAGMIGSRIADIPGCSDVFSGGIISYSNEVKKAVLGVPEEVLNKFGVVSEECAAAMAEGARRALGVSIAVSVTGVAGPGGGSPENPVGTVCFGISDENGTSSFTCRFGSNRDRGKIRRLTVATAIIKLTERLLSQTNS